MQGVDKGFLLYNGAQQMFGHDELVPVRLGLSLCGSECLVYEYRIFISILFLSSYSSSSGVTVSRRGKPSLRAMRVAFCTLEWAMSYE